MANFQVRRINKNNNEYFLLILRDVTERRYLEQELFKITENLEQLVQEKTLELQKKNQMLE
jgi:nitrate/nitrite-specific signal transduction histidine kinase